MSKSKVKKSGREARTSSLREIAATTILKASAPQSGILDPFDKSYSSDKIVRPPLNPMVLARMAEESDTLGQCFEAMETNVHGFGYELVVANHLDEKFDPMTPDPQSERARLNMLFNYANFRQNLTDVRKLMFRDQQSIGDGFIEVVRNMTGDIAELHHLPAAWTRKTVFDVEPTEVIEKIRDEEGKFVDVVRFVKFRRFVQIINGNKKVYFKEFGDPRDISSKTGEVVKKGSVLATEVINLSETCTYSPYGMPKWIGNLMGILGSRKSEEINFLYFDNKTIPPMVITVSGGQLTQETVEMLKDVIHNQVRGVENFHRPLIIESVPDSIGTIEGEKVAQTKVEIKPLTQFMQQDALFREYRNDISRAVQSSFRMHPIFLGKSDDYTRATAGVATQVTEEQVFQPDRNRFDYMMNRRILADMAINFWDFKSLGGKTSDDASALEAIAGVKEAVPLGMILQAVSDVMGVPVPDLPQEIADTPLILLSGGASSFEDLADGKGKSKEDDDPDKLDKATQIMKAIIDLRKMMKDDDDNKSNAA